MRITELIQLQPSDKSSRALSRVLPPSYTLSPQSPQVGEEEEKTELLISGLRTVKF